MPNTGTDNFLQIAKVLKSNGTGGELVMSFQNTVPEDINLQEPVFIFYDGLPVPFFIQELRQKGSRVFVRLNDIICYEDAEEIVGKNVYIEKPEDYEEEKDINYLLGWTVKDSNGDRIGLIEDIEDIPGNPCIYVGAEKGQVMIPLNEELILSVNTSIREISMIIPKVLI